MFSSIRKFSNKQNVKNANKEEKRMLATESTKHDDEDMLDDSQEELTVDKAIELYKPDFVPNQRIEDSENLKKYTLYAAILGDISGSAYEGVRLPSSETYETVDMFTRYHHFTDDTVLTIAIYNATQKLKENNISNDDEIVSTYTEFLKNYTRLYPDAGYGGGYFEWAMSDVQYRNHSYGNGSCMRVSGIAVLFDDVDDVIKYAYFSALPSHSHNEGIKGAICTSVIYWMLSYGASKEDVVRYIQKHYPVRNEYQINGNTKLQDLINMDKINPWSTLSMICQTSLVEAVINFVESDSFESCLRNSYKYLCDRDTISAIAAPMAALYYKDISYKKYSGESIVEAYLEKKLLDVIRE